MSLEKQIAKIKFLTYGALAVAVLGFILLIVGLIASAVVIDVLGVLLMIAGIGIALYIYPEVKKYEKIKCARNEILNAKCLSEIELANKLHVTERKARELIDVCFRKGHVAGYVRKGQKIYHHEEYANESERSGKSGVAIECENCGANFKGVSGEVNECPYCRSFINA